MTGIKIPAIHFSVKYKTYPNHLSHFHSCFKFLIPFNRFHTNFKNLSLSSMKLHDFFPMPTVLNNAGERSYSPTHQREVHLLGHLALMPFFYGNFCIPLDTYSNVIVSHISYAPQSIY